MTSFQMSPFVAHREYVCRKYYVDVLSKGFSFFVLAVIFQLIFPLLLSSESGDFWRTRAEFHERPKVKFTGKLVAIAEVETEKGERDQMVFSSFEKFLDEYEPYFRIPFIQHREEDTDEDGILDQLKLDLEFPLQETERSRGISLMLLFSFALRDQHRLTMDALAFVQSPPLNTRRSRTIPNQYEFKTVGFLSTHQFIPLPSPGHPMTSFRLENAFPVRQLQAPSVDFRELAVGYLTSGNNSKLKILPANLTPLEIMKEINSVVLPLVPPPLEESKIVQTKATKKQKR
ncbi:unnamed protein product [Notodromas monacha]|uniref:Transmembrane protein 231 n=1 Tax=Notodromas monacha TaxID=399045 RepID=A0A7R9GEY4_9CRUS|nr:unnamed protein product [Notodromas monacha]CAG0920230.1 unnamed protein product [Notodromas monacha]